MRARSLAYAVAVAVALATAGCSKPKGSRKATKTECAEAYLHTSEVQFRESGKTPEEAKALIAATRDVVVGGKTEGVSPDAVAKFKELVDTCAATYTKAQVDCMAKVTKMSEVGPCAAAR
jgi:hypothetical protein